MDQESQGYSFKQGGQSRLCWEVFNFLSKKAEESDGVSHVDIQGKAFQAKGPEVEKARRQGSTWLVWGRSCATQEARERGSERQGASPRCSTLEVMGGL